MPATAPWSSTRCSPRASPTDLAASAINDLPAEEMDEDPETAEPPKLDLVRVYRTPADRAEGSLVGCTVLGELRTATLEEATRLARLEYGDDIVLESLPG